MLVKKLKRSEILWGDGQRGEVRKRQIVLVKWEKFLGLLVARYDIREGTVSK